MGASHPILYDPAPSSSSTRRPDGSPPPPMMTSTPTTREFDTKALMQQTLYSPTRMRPKSEGPAVDFNKHPDSYLILPYGNLEAKPMSPRTRKTVTYMRKVTLALRCLQLAGAVGLLVCVVCLRKIEESLGWTLRIPPAIAIMHCVYAIYNLARSPTGRTPTSTASYMLFATAVDGIFIPFYVFTALTSHTQHAKAGKMVWRSVFDDPAVADRKVVYAIFLLGVVDGALHVLTLLLSLFLAIVFRKIAKLPPDMNPLEDNLTSRHKRTSKRELLAEEKRNSRATVYSTVSAVSGHVDPRRSSQAHEPLIQQHQQQQQQQQYPPPPPRSIPFMHTRTESTESLGGAYRNSPRDSRADLPSQYSHQHHHQHDMSPSSKRSSRADLSRSSAVISPSKRASYYRIDGHGSTQQQQGLKHESRNSLVNDNWYTYFGHEDPSTDENLARSSSLVSSLKEHEMRMPNDAGHGLAHQDHDLNQDIGQQRLDGGPHHHHRYDDGGDDDEEEEEEEVGFYYDHQPMDEPYPHPHPHPYRQPSSQHQDQRHSPSPPPPPPSTMMTNNQPPFRRLMPNPLESNPPTPPPASAKPRRAAPPAPQAPAPPATSAALPTAAEEEDNEEEQHHHHHGNDERHVLRQSSSSSLNRSVSALKAKLYGDLKPATPPVMGTYVDLPITRNTTINTTRNTTNNTRNTSTKMPATNGRVVSNSGTDYSYHAGDDGAAGAGGSGRRDVSGKVAEEGRAGGGWTRFRKVSGM